MTWPAAVAVGLALLLYLRSPIDLLPDRLGAIGLVDDLLVLVTAIWWLRRRSTRAKAVPSRAATATADTTGNAAWDPHAVLGVTRDASAQEIARAYREQMNRYHPDHVAHLGRGAAGNSPIGRRSISSGLTRRSAGREDQPPDRSALAARTTGLVSRRGRGRPAPRARRPRGRLRGRGRRSWRPRRRRPRARRRGRGGDAADRDQRRRVTARTAPHERRSRATGSASLLLVGREDRPEREIVGAARPRRAGLAQVVGRDADRAARGRGRRARPRPGGRPARGARRRPPRRGRRRRGR